MTQFGFRASSLFVNLLLLSLAFTACENDTPADDSEITATDVLQDKTTDQDYPDGKYAEGFIPQLSSPEALKIADSVVIAHGGREAYDNTRYFKWNFFGVRDLTWDKQAQRVRIAVPEGNTVYLLDYSGDENTGRVMIDGEEITNPDSLAMALDRAESIFINDSYWLVQPFKLTDPGVQLRFTGASNDPVEGRPSYVIQQTFTDVGDTPQNKYVLYVDRETHRINTWQFFREAADTEPAMETPYRGYGEFNGLMLSTDRGDRYQLGGVETPEEISEGVFGEF